MKILLYEKPYITSYPVIASTLSILKSKPKTIPWIMTQYIQVLSFDKTLLGILILKCIFLNVCAIINDLYNHFN